MASCEFAIDGRETGGDDAAGAGVFYDVLQRSGKGDDGAGAEAEAGQGEGQGRVAAAEFGETGTGILHLAGTAVVDAVAEVDAAEVEAQDGAAGAAQGARRCGGQPCCAACRRRAGGDGRPARPRGARPSSGSSSRASRRSGGPATKNDSMRRDTERRQASVGAVVGELHVDAEVVGAEQGDDLLERVAVAAADAHEIALDGGLDFF